MFSETDLNAFERTLLHQLTAGDHPALSGLRRQADAATVRKRVISGFGIETELSVPPDIAPVRPSDFELSDVAFSLAYGPALSSASRGAPHEEELAQASLVVKDGCLAGLQAHLIFELWPMERAADGSPHYQAEPDLRDGPYYVDREFDRLTGRDFERVRELLGT